MSEVSKIVRSDEKPLINGHNLKIGYGKRVILDNVDFSVYPGQILTLIGPNGCGKSTLLKTITGQQKKLGGDICIKGRNMEMLSLRELASTVSIVMTMRPNPEYMTCLEVVSLGRYPYTNALGILTDADRIIVDKYMGDVGVRELSGRYFNELSDGQRQRVMLARALCQEPDILVLDEPTSFLDLRYKLEFVSLVRALSKREGLCVIMSLHELYLARMVSDLVMCIDKTGTVRIDSPEEIFSGDLIKEVFELGDYSVDAQTGDLQWLR